MKTRTSSFLLLLAVASLVMTTAWGDGDWDALLMDTVSSYYAIDFPPIDLSSGVTYEMLDKVDHNMSGDYIEKYIFNQRLASYAVSISLIMMPNNDQADAWDLYISPSGYREASFIKTLQNGTYYHIALVLSSSGENAHAKVFVDGTCVLDDFAFTIDPQNAACCAHCGEGSQLSNDIKVTCAGMRIWDRALSDAEIQQYNWKLVGSNPGNGLVFQSGWGIKQSGGDSGNWWNLLGDGLYGEPCDYGGINHVDSGLTNIALYNVVSTTSIWSTIWLNNGQLPAYVSSAVLPAEGDYTYEVLFTVPEVVGAPQYILHIKDADYNQYVEVLVTNQNIEAQSYQLAIVEMCDDRVVGSRIIDRTFFAGDVHQLALTHETGHEQVSPFSSHDIAFISYSIDGDNPVYVYTQQRDSTIEIVYLGYDLDYPRYGAAPLLVHGWRMRDHVLSALELKESYRRKLPADTAGLLMQCGWGLCQTGNYSEWQNQITNNFGNFEAKGMQGISTLNTNVGVIGLSSMVSFQGQLLEDDSTPAAVAARQGIVVFSDADAREVWRSAPQSLTADTNGYFSFLIDAGNDTPTNRVENIVMNATNGLFMSFLVQDLSSPNNPYEIVYPEQPLISVPYVLKADYMEGADTLEVLGGGVLVKGDASFNCVQVEYLNADQIETSEIGTRQLLIDQIGQAGDVVTIADAVVVDDLILKNDMLKMLTSMPAPVALESYTPDRPSGREQVRWWKQMPQDGFLTFSVVTPKKDITKAIAVCARQYNAENVVTPVTLYTNWLNGVYSKQLLNCYDADVTNGACGISLPVSAGMYIGFLAEQSDGSIGSAFEPDGRYEFKNGWFTPLGQIAQ